MTAVEILGRLNDLGVSVRVNGNKVRVAPVSAVPGELLAEAKAHKQELIDELAVTYGDGQPPPLDRPPATEQELRRLMDYIADPDTFDSWLDWARERQRSSTPTRVASSPASPSPVSWNNTESGPAWTGKGGTPITSS